MDSKGARLVPASIVTVGEESPRKDIKESGEEDC